MGDRSEYLVVTGTGSDFGCQLRGEWTGSDLGPTGGYIELMSLLGKASQSIRDNHHWGLSFPLKDPESKDTCNDVRVLHTKFFVTTLFCQDQS